MKLNYLTLYIFSLTICFAETVELIHIDYNNNKTIETVNSNITEYRILNGYKKSIMGLENLHSLHTIRVERVHYIEKDLDFLKDLTNIKTLYLSFIEIISFDFLKDWKNLELLVIQATQINTDSINLINTEKLRYLEISNCHISALPDITYSKSSPLEQLNFAYNNITLEGVRNSINFLEHSKSVIFLNNPIMDQIGANEVKNVKIETGSIINILKPEYLQYLL